jgi:hypothetical protein
MVRERPSRRVFLLAGVVAGASFALAGGVKPSPPARSARRAETLGELLDELGQVFGKLTTWRLRCKEQNATTEADLIRLAEEVLAQPCTGTVAEGHCRWLRLNGAQSVPCPATFAPLFPGKTGSKQVRSGKFSPPRRPVSLVAWRNRQRPGSAPASAVRAAEAA